MRRGTAVTVKGQSIARKRCGDPLLYQVRDESRKWEIRTGTYTDDVLNPDIHLDTP